MKNLRQVVTKAVIAKGKKRTEKEVTLIPPNRPSSILGCWVINHTHSAKKSGRSIDVNGKFDVNVWYSHHDHSKTSVFTETVSYRDTIDLRYRDEPSSSKEEIRVEVLQQPNCTEAIISECQEKFIIKVERELLAEVIGETKVMITVHPNDFEEDWSFDEDSSHHQSHSNENSSRVGKDAPPF